MTIREFSITLGLVAFACVGCFLLWRARLASGGLKRFLRVAGVLAILLSAFESLHWISKRGSRMPAPVFTLESPDAQLFAEIVEPEGDLMPTELVRISVRRGGHILAEQVFKGAVEPNVDWLDNHTLRLTYPKTSNAPLCGGSWSGATIVCREVAPSEFKPRLRE
jgi:hypothetical protein